MVMAHRQRILGDSARIVDVRSENAVMSDSFNLVGDGFDWLPQRVHTL